MDSSNGVINVVTPPLNPAETKRVFDSVLSREPWKIWDNKPETPSLNVASFIERWDVK